MHLFRRALPVVASFGLAALALAGPALPAGAAPGDPVDRGAEAANFTKQSERAPVHLSPEGVQALAADGGPADCSYLAVATTPDR